MSENLEDIADQILVLALDLVETEVENLPRRVADALTSADVRKAVEKKLLDFAKKRGESGSTAVTQQEARKLIEALGESAKDATLEHIVDQVKDSQKYKNLQERVNTFAKAAKSTPLGIWLSENGTTVYIVGAALVLGAGSVLYVTKSGGVVIDGVMDRLKNAKFDVLTLGKLKLGIGSPVFQPTAQVVGGKITGQIKWEKLEVEFKFGLLVNGPKVASVSGEAVVKSGPVTVDLSAIQQADKKVDLNLRVKYSRDQVDVNLGAFLKDGAPGVKAGAGFKAGPAKINAEGSFSRKDGRNDTAIMGTITIPW